MNAAPVRVLLVDDQALFREALATLLDVRDDTGDRVDNV
jgi:DNA-binding NarL/FixJ family response regulator